jgi:hypothetical protein
MTDASSRKPTPVRQSLPEGTAVEETRFASRSFETEGGESWLAEELGWTRSGRREDPGTPLLLLGFRPEGTEEEDGGFEREALVPVRRLSDLPEISLRELLDSARPFQGAAPERSFFAATRSRGREAGGRRRNHSRG